MKKSLFILTFIILFKISSGQDTTRRFEFGSTILTANSFLMDNSYSENQYYSNWLAIDRPSLELINGLFFRYTKKRLALRVHASYSNYSAASTYTTETWPYGPIGGDINNNSFQIGVGGQFSILKQKPWFYSCLDITYRHVNSIGHSYGEDFSRKFTSTINGADCFIGLGFKIKLLKNFYLSPEVGYNTSLQFIKSVTTSTEPFLYINRPNKFSYSELSTMPILKLHLTVKF